MKTVIKRASRMTIEEFAEKHGLTMVLTERRKQYIRVPHERWLAHFDNCETKDGCILSGTYGQGATTKEAIADYADKITGKLLVIDAYGDNRREIWVDCDFTSEGDDE